MILPLSVNWSAVNTALILAAGGYLYRQSRVVDQLRQALVGYGGSGGALQEIRELRQRTAELITVMSTVNITIGHLTAQLAELHMRSPAARSRVGDRHAAP